MGVVAFFLAYLTVDRRRFVPEAEGETEKDAADENDHDNLVWTDSGLCLLASSDPIPFHRIALLIIS